MSKNSVNAQLNKLCFGVDPDEAEIYAFTLCCFKLYPYIFPPFRLNGRVLNKILSDKVEQSILIVPLLKTQSLFSLIYLIFDIYSCRLRRHKDLLVIPTLERTIH